MILLSVGPGPEALSAPVLCDELASAGHRLEVILEPGTERFVGPAAFSDLAVVVEEPTQPPEAIAFTSATSGTLARLARGLDDGSAMTHPTVVAPAPDEETASHPAILENLELLQRDGHRVLGNGASSAEISGVILGSLGGPLTGLRLLVAAGGTREPIDSVRFVGNRSSGKMGLALAREARRRGAEVAVVAANMEVVEPGLGWTAVETAGELRRAVLERAEDADALVMAAAVSDFAPAAPVREKIRRGEGLTMELVPTEDILGSVRESYPELFVVGFAATHGDPLSDAREKLDKKGADLMVGNDISREGIGFASEENEVSIVGRGLESFVPRSSKEEVARVILDTLAEKIRETRTA